MPEFEGNEEEERSGTTDQQARDQDAEKKKRGDETEKRELPKQTLRKETKCCCFDGSETSCLHLMIQAHTV